MPAKQGIDALKDIYRKNPGYFDQFLKEADRRAVEILGPLFRIDHKTWQQFREEHLLAHSPAQEALQRLHQQLSALIAETSQFITPPAPGQLAAKRKYSKRRSRILKPRLTPEQKQDRARAKKLRLQAHKLVLSVAKKKDISPAIIYAELTKKYGHKAREADATELESRIAYLKSKT
jgi:multidrug resistance efflux pump